MSSATRQKVPVLRAYLRRWKVEVGVFFEEASVSTPPTMKSRPLPRAKLPSRSCRRADGSPTTVELTRRPQARSEREPSQIRRPRVRRDSRRCWLAHALEPAGVGSERGPEARMDAIDHPPVRRRPIGVGRRAAGRSCGGAWVPSGVRPDGRVPPSTSAPPRGTQPAVEIDGGAQLVQLEVLAPSSRVRSRRTWPCRRSGPTGRSPRASARGTHEQAR